jgi:hypothetical protein
MSQIKKVEKLYNQKYYLEHKEEKGIKLRDEVNKINGAIGFKICFRFSCTK